MFKSSSLVTNQSRPSRCSLHSLTQPVTLAGTMLVVKVMLPASSVCQHQNIYIRCVFHKRSLILVATRCQGTDRVLHNSCLQSDKSEYLSVTRNTSSARLGHQAVLMLLYSYFNHHNFVSRNLK